MAPGYTTVCRCGPSGTAKPCRGHRSLNLRSRTRCTCGSSCSPAWSVGWQAGSASRSSRIRPTRSRSPMYSPSTRAPQHWMLSRKSPRCWSARSKSFPGSKILCRDHCPDAQRSRLSSITRYQPVIQAKSGMSYDGGSPRRPCVCQPAPTHPGSRMISATFMACSTDLPSPTAMTSPPFEMPPDYSKPKSNASSMWQKCGSRVFRRNRSRLISITHSFANSVYLFIASSRPSTAPRDSSPPL